MGCLAYVRIPNPKRRKLASRAYECVFIWYCESSKAYTFYDLNNKLIIESNHGDFFKDRFSFKFKISGGLVSQTSGDSIFSSLPSVRI